MRHASLAERGVFDGIMRRAHERRPLTPTEIARNPVRVPVRSAVERVFGTLEHSDGWGRVRYRRLARNAAPPPICSASPSTCAGLTSSPDDVDYGAGARAAPAPNGLLKPVPGVDQPEKSPRSRRSPRTRGLSQKALRG